MHANRLPPLELLLAAFGLLVVLLLADSLDDLLLTGLVASPLVLLGAMYLVGAAIERAD